MPATLALALLLSATPSVVVAPAEARPGDAVLVRVRGGETPPVGALAGRPLAFWRAGDEWRALGALPIETPLGPAAVFVDWGGLRAEGAFQVVDPGFPSRALTVSPKFVEPPKAVRARIASDRRAFAAAYERELSPPLFAGPFAWPRQDRITGRFGDQRVFNGKTESVHYGLDVAGPRGAPVLAANDGLVVLARNAYLSGKSVVLWHGAGIFTVYFHMDRIDVAPGKKVRKGARLGRVGSTGRSTGPHLHWSTRVAGLFVDPESLLGIDFASGTAPPREARPLPPPPAPEAPVEAPEPPHPAPPGAGPAAQATPTVAPTR